MPRFFATVNTTNTTTAESTIDNKLHVYLAGPDVFKPNPIEVGKKKKDLVNQAGHVGHFPMDPELDGFAHNPETAYKIGAANEGLMKKSQVILVNMTPFHGASMDVGTANEVGYMSAKYDFDPDHEVLIIGYYEGDYEPNFAQRVQNIALKGEEVVTDEFGGKRDKNGMALEDFGLSENLMIPHAIHKTGGKIYPSFEEAVENIQKLWELRHPLTVEKIGNLADVIENDGDVVEDDALSENKVVTL